MVEMIRTTTEMYRHGWDERNGGTVSLMLDENEVAQSECCTGKPFARFWLHNGYINVNNTKMSKSLGNFFTVRDVAEKYGYPAIRFFILSAHYRSPINYSADILEQSKNALERIGNCIGNLEFYLKTAPAGEIDADTKAKIDARKSAFIEAMDDDFNTADGIAAIFDLVRDANELMANAANASAVAHAEALLKELCGLMGFLPEKAANDDFTAEIEAKIAERAAAKKAKDYKKADAIRAELLGKGVILEDTPKGTKYRIEKQ